MSDDGAQKFVQPPGGRFAIGCGMLFIGLPAIAIAGSALVQGAILPAAIVATVAVAILALAYWFFNEEVSMTLDARGLRLSRTRLLLGVRLAERVDWEISAASLTKAREVTRKTPAKNGGWSYSTRIELPEGRTLDASELGGAEDPEGAYAALVRALKKRLGNAFERVESQS